MSSRRRVAWLAVAAVVLVAAVLALRGRSAPPDANSGENSRPVGTAGAGGRSGARGVPV